MGAERARGMDSSTPGLRLATSEQLALSLGGWRCWLPAHFLEMLDSWYIWWWQENADAMINGAVNALAGTCTLPRAFEWSRAA